MKKVSAITAAVLLMTSVLAQAQSASVEQTSLMKQARIQLEKDNEQKILERLEAVRLQEERNRMERIQNMSFSVVNAPAAPATTQNF